jgi:hypothetical protein
LVPIEPSARLEAIRKYVVQPEIRDHDAPRDGPFAGKVHVRRVLSRVFTRTAVLHQRSHLEPSVLVEVETGDASAAVVGNEHTSSVAGTRHVTRSGTARRHDAGPFERSITSDVVGTQSPARRLVEVVEFVDSEQISR